MTYLKLSTLLISLTFLTSCNSQISKNEFYSKELKWKIEIPSGFEEIKTDDWSKMQNKGIEDMEKTFNKDIENQARTIFSFKKGKLNIFESNIQPFDPKIDGDYFETNDGVHYAMFETIKGQVNGAKIDSLSFTKTISGKEFDSFKVAVTFPNNLTLTTLTYSRLFGKKDFTVNITYIDEKEGIKMIENWEKSVFE